MLGICGLFRLRAMKKFTPRSDIHPAVLATDLDGTLIPLPGDEKNRTDLETIKAKRISFSFRLVYATGRHLESVKAAIEHYGLPVPDWMVCDVGTSIYRKRGDSFEPFEPYITHLIERTSGLDRAVVESLLREVDGLEMQVPAHQGRFKISYESDLSVLRRLVGEIDRRMDAGGIPYACLGSVDPFRDRGLLDVLPRAVSKAYALIWLATHADFSPDAVIYAGDSGNDLDALVSGFRAIVVANGTPGLAERVTREMEARALPGRVYLSDKRATSGVLDGCRHFGLFG